MATPAVISTDPKADWMTEAAEAIARLAARSAKCNVTFTADDLRREVGEPDHPNWVGSAFSAAAQTKVIRPVGFTISRAPTRHGGVIRTWRAVA